MIQRFVPVLLLWAATVLFWLPYANAQVPSGPVKIVVKLRPALATAVESELPAGTGALSAGALGATSGQAFLNRHRAQRVTPLYPRMVGLKKQTGLSDIQIAAGVRQRFPQRANRLRGAFQSAEISRAYVLEMDGTQRPRLAEILAELNADPDIEYAEEDKTISVDFTPNDPYFSSSGSWGQSYADLWGIKKIGAPTAWDTTSGAGITVAVVDTGVDYTHADLAANVWTNPAEIPGNGIDDDHNGYVDDVRGWDFVGASYLNPTQSNNPVDHHGHGTHVSGTIAAGGNNGIGVIGVAWNARVMAVKGLDDTGSGPLSSLAAAIQYAADNGADIINASWGGIGSSQTIADAVNYAYNLGVVIVAAAGNNSSDARGFSPAGLWNVITVAASDQFDSLAGFSNYGSKIDVAAPGVDILSLQASGTNMGPSPSAGYVRASGTSMAAPHVSGLAALILSHTPTYSNEDVRQVVRVSASDVGTSGFDLSFGYGRINAGSAVGVTGALEAKINAPMDGIVTQGLLTISGVARGTGFASYTLEYGAGSLPTTWNTIQTGTSPVSGTLGVFDTTSLASGVYVVQLTVRNTLNQSFTDRIQVTANPIYISSPVPPSSFTASSTTFKNGTVISISGSAVGANFQGFLVDWAPGSSPLSGWQSSGVTLTGGGLSPISNGLLASWNTSPISNAGYYTIRLTVNSNNTTRQAFTTVYLEPDLLSSNWPQYLTQAPYFNSGTVPALNGDGTTRLMLEAPTNGPGTGILWTLTPTGSQQQTLLPSFGSYQQPATADLGGNPGEETIVTDYDGIHVFDPNGTSSYALTTSTLDYTRNHPAIEDLTGNSTWTTVALGSNLNNQTAQVTAWRPDGSIVSGFPVQVADQNPVASQYNLTRVLVGDLNGDGSKEVVVQEGLSSTTLALRRFASDGASQSWSVPVLSGKPAAMAAADLDHNGKLETILATNSGSQTILHVFQPDGSERPGWPVTLPSSGQFSLSFLAVGDFNRDGHYQILCSHETNLYLFNDNGTLFPGAWPRQATFPRGFAAGVIGDINGDGFPEIVTALENSGADFQLLAIDKTGTTIKSWRLTGANGYIPYAYPAPALGDFNQDGITDVAVAYELFGSPSQVAGLVTLLSTGSAYNSLANDWPLIHRNNRNTNVKTWAEGFVSATSTALVSDLNPSLAGQAVTLTATVTALIPGAGPPVGTVMFYEGTTNLGSVVADANAQAKLTIATLSVGTPNVTARYGGSNSFTASISGAVTQTVNQASTTTNLSSAANPAVAGESVVLTAMVAAVPPSTAMPSGTVTFYDGATNLGFTALNASGQAQLTLTSLALGAHSLTAVYGGNSNYSGSASSVVTQTINQADSSIVLFSTTNPTVFGQGMTLSVVVAALLPSIGQPTGVVTFYDGATSIGTATTNGSGQAQLTTATLDVGSHSLTATYAGNSAYTGSASTAVAQTVNQAPSSTSLSTINPSLAYRSTIMIATVAAVAPGSGLPTGIVTFYDGTTSLGTGTVNGSGQAQVTVTTLTAGVHSLTAAYEGDGHFVDSTSAIVTQTVNQAATVTSLSPIVSNPSVAREPLAMTVFVSRGPSIGGVLTGTVTFDDGTITLGIASITGAGIAQLTVVTLSPGTHSITATYSGDSNFTGSTSPVLMQTVNQASSTTAISSIVNPTVFRQQVILSATVAATPPSTGVPGGTVTFHDGVSSLGTGNISAGLAQLTVANLGAGTHNITATYSGDSNYTGSTSSAMMQTVNKLSTFSALISSLNPAVPGQALVLTAMARSDGGGMLTGTVTLLDNGASIGTGVLDSNGQARFTLSAALPVGTHSLTARYEGDANYLASTAPAINQLMAVAMFDVPGPQVVSAGQKVAIPLTLYEAFGSDMAFELSCVGLPANSSCNFDINPVMPAAPPTGTTVLLTVSTQAASKLAPPTSEPQGIAKLLLVGVVLMVSFIFSRFKSTRLALGACCFTLVIGLAMCGCAGGGNANTSSGTTGGGGSGGTGTNPPGGTPKGAAVVTINGTSGPTVITTSVSLTIQ